MYEEVLDWVRKARSGDREAIGALYLFLRAKLLPRLGQKVRRTCISAEDVLHDVILAFLERPDRLREANCFLNYETTAALRLLKRERGRQQYLCLDSRDLEKAVDDPSSRNLEAEEMLARALTVLDAKELQLFRILFIDGGDLAEAGRLLGITRSNATWRKHSLRAKLRSALSSSGKSPACSRDPADRRNDRR